MNLLNLTLGSDLPVEDYKNMGINRSPPGILCCLLLPEIITLFAYMVLTW